ncbi:hypothetical protein DL771_003100 [Monosporascus sp. 5C6A]|nr:hypothetical protein DL771_003100 [Monosporascus sp. 5C6A]
MSALLTTEPSEDNVRAPRDLLTILQTWGYEVAIIRSDTLQDDRNRTIQAFNNANSKLQMLLTSIELSAFALNLQWESCKGMVIQWPWSINHLLQVLGRLIRLGQTRFVEHVVSILAKLGFGVVGIRSSDLNKDKDAMVHDFNDPRSDVTVFVLGRLHRLGQLKGVEWRVLKVANSFYDIQENRMCRKTVPNTIYDRLEGIIWKKYVRAGDVGEFILR